MARVKRGVTSHAKHKKALKAAKGFYRPAQEHDPHRQGRGRQVDAVRLPRPQEQEAHIPGALDPAPQRGGARARPDLFAIYRRPRQGGDRGRSQGVCPRWRSTSRRHSPPMWSAPRARCRHRGSGLSRTAGGANEAPSSHPSEAFPPAARPSRRVRLRAEALDGRARDGINPRESRDPDDRSRRTRTGPARRRSRARPTRPRSRRCASSALGKKGAVSDLLKTLGAMTPDERKEKGPLINGLRDKVQGAIATRREALAEAALEQRLAAERIDVTPAGARRRRRRAGASTRSAR